MKIEEFQQNRFTRNLIRDRWLIGLSAGVMTVFSGLYVLTIYKPAYESEAKVWIKDTSTRSYLSESGNQPGYLSPLTQAGNPLMTQAEILKSKEMAAYLSDFVARHQLRSQWAKTLNGQPNTWELIEVKTEPNTDVLQVALKWNNPQLARDMLRAVLRKLDETNLVFNRQIYTQKRRYVDQQLKGIEKNLLAVRERIKQFQAGNMAVDIDAQTQELVRLKSQLSAQLASVQAARRNSMGNASALQRHLAMNPGQALQAVALGSGNENLVKMRTDLVLLKQQYAKDGIKLATTNPTMQATRAQIQALESQVRREIEQTTGQSSVKGPLIFDSVRSQLVQDLAASSARSVGLNSEATSLVSAIQRVDAALREIPQNRYVLTGLKEEEQALALAYDELRKMQIETRIKEAETPSNVFVVDAPSVPLKQSFPTGAHLVFLSMLMGLGVGMGLSVLKTRVEDRCEGAEAVSAVTQGKTLGVVPWLEEPPEGRATRDQSMFTLNDMACKHIIGNLRIQAVQAGAKVIVFTSSALEKPLVGGAYHLAQCMSRLGQSVAFIDADCRPSGLAGFLENTADSQDLSDTILATDLKLRSDQAIYPDEILRSLRQDVNGIYLAFTCRPMQNPYDYFASRGFNHILQVLKAEFDWVFVDTPAGAITPEFMAIAHISDGVVLFVDRHATFKGLKSISGKIRAAGVPLLGTIVREENRQLEFQQSIYEDWQNPRGGGGLTVTLGGTPRTNPRRVEVMGAYVDALSMSETVDRIVESIDQGQPIQHVVVNVAKLVAMRHDKKLRKVVNGCELINADGAGVVLGARLLGINIPERVTGIDLMGKLIEVASQKKYRVYFLGATQSVVQDLVAHYQQKYPNLRICGYRNGYFSKEEEAQVAHKIRQAKPDMLLVAMSTPKKEAFITEYKKDMNVPFIMGVGGSFDVVAGKVKRAPEWMQRYGLEWFYRLIQEPRRMWKRYLLTNAEFGFMLAGKAVSRQLAAVYE
jgi:N-acetylglucosaminyldiphosphoundecaprenol N-acetyl-beta-D-mannosaminyltransferase